MAHGEKLPGTCKWLLGPTFLGSDIIIRLPTCITNIGIFVYLCGESWSPDVGRMLISRTFHKLYCTCMLLYAVFCIIMKSCDQLINLTIWLDITRFRQQNFTIIKHPSSIQCILATTYASANYNMPSWSVYIWL